MLLAAAVMFVLTPAQASDKPPVSSYTATATLLAESRPTAEGQPATQSMSLGRLALYITTGEIPQRAAEKLGFGDDPALLAEQIVVTPDTEGGAVTVAATHVTGLDEATARKNALATLKATVPLYESDGEITGAIVERTWGNMTTFMKAQGLIDKAVDGASMIDPSVLAS